MKAILGHLVWAVMVVNRRYFLWARWKRHYECRGIRKRFEARGYERWSRKQYAAIIAPYEADQRRITARYSRIHNWGMWAHEVLTGYKLQSVGELQRKGVTYEAADFGYI